MVSAHLRALVYISCIITNPA